MTRSDAAGRRVLLVSAIFATPRMPYTQGGAEIVAQRLADALVARGLEVTALRAGRPGTDLSDEQPGAIPVRTLEMRRPYWPFDQEERGRLRRIAWHAIDDWGDERAAAVMTAVRPDVIHTHNIGGLSTGIWRAAARLGIPVVHTLHDYYLICPRTTRFRNGTVCGALCSECRLLTRRRRADTRLVGDVVGVSGAVLAQHVEQDAFAGARHHVVPNIIEQHLVADPVACGTPPTFGFLGRITLEKGVEQLVSAYAAMARPARLVFGGRIDEAMRARLIALADGKPIEFLGFVRPGDFFRAIDVLVVPSVWRDPLPTVILEGQTAGKPTIGSTRGGIPEAIGDDGAGWTYDPDAPGALATLLDQVAGDPATILAKAQAAHAASARFREAAVVDRYIGIYDRAVAEAVSRR